MSELTIFIPESEWLSANGRFHWAAKARRTKTLRQRGFWAAKQTKASRHDRLHVTAFIQYPTGGRADPANSAPTVKALIDGMVDAGVLPDDDSTHLIGPDFRRDTGRCQRGWHRVRLVLTDQEVKF